jgi:hypothetical protein
MMIMLRLFIVLSKVLGTNFKHGALLGFTQSKTVTPADL